MAPAVAAPPREVIGVRALFHHNSLTLAGRIRGICLATSHVFPISTNFFIPENDRFVAACKQTNKIKHFTVLLFAILIKSMLLVLHLVLTVRACCVNNTHRRSSCCKPSDHCLLLDCRSCLLERNGTRCCCSST